MKPTTANNRSRSTRRGQTLVIAIMVMFILAVISAVFIALVARNLFRSERFSNVDSVAQIAEAGIRYADKMLVSSEDGADWRPRPDNLGVTNTPVYPDTPPAALGTWRDLQDRNPDFKWIRAYWPTDLGYAGPSGGFSTFNTGEGRFLLRVSYNPNPKDPYSKFIKIESIGRWGIVDNADPTTWKPHGNSQLRREITAFKPIGVTDYLRFITNKNNRSADFGLGCPGFDIAMGRLDTRPGWRRGAPIRVNGNLVWYGDNVKLHLRGTHPIGDSTTLIPLDGVEVSGDIKVADPGTSVTLQPMDTSGTALGTGPIPLLPSDDDLFATESGFYRDGRDSLDADNAARGVKRMEPPLVDQMDPTNTITRYQVLTLNSATIVNPGGGYGNPARFGWGRGVYIDNMNDKQDESDTLTGGLTLRADWTKPNNVMARNWKGPYYVPPAAIIILHPGDTDHDGQADFTIVRSDTTAQGRDYVWRDAWMRARPEWGGTVTMPYPDAKKGRVIRRVNSSGVQTGESITLEGNGVIYAEGNIRIRGMLPQGLQLTVVSNQNIYIDGNLLKYRPESYTGGTDPYRGGDETCGLSLLARENVCVNTTQFFAPTNLENVGSDAQEGKPQYHLTVTSAPESQFRCKFDFGPWESENTTTAPSAWSLFLRHSGEYGPTYINAWLNPDDVGPTFGMLTLNPVSLRPAPQPLPRHVWGIGDPQYTPAGWGVDSMFVGNVFPLNTDTKANLRTLPGFANLLQIGLDQTSYTRHNYELGGVAVQPMDIRIEAVIYAQEGSFFVIPGTWFNPDPNDVPGSTRPGVQAEFPYFGQALDVRVIIDGAVSENTPAAISDVDDWMSKWGRIPDRYGSSSRPTSHPGEGLTLLYDDHAGWPLSGLQSATPTPIRTDSFGRTLPFTPRLPVSSSLIYFGDVM